MQHQIKLIVTDLDGTLLRDDKTISDYTKSVLQKCRNAGIKVAYATARGGSAKKLLPPELFDGYVCMNGALAYADGALVYNKLMPMDSARPLLLAADREGIGITAEAKGVHYSNVDLTKIWQWITNCEIADFATLDIQIEKLYTVADSAHVVDLINAHLGEDLYLNISRDNFAMVMHKDATKSKALAALAHHWGIPQSSIVAFGDDTNDLDLLAYCGTSVAMANALDQTKAAVGHVCGTNNDDGVAHWLEQNLNL